MRISGSETQRQTRTEHTAAILQPGPQASLVSETEFMSKGDFTTHQYLKACWYYTHSSGDLRRTNKQSQIYFHGSQTASSNADQYGALQFGTGERLRWRSSGGMLVYGTPSDSNRNTKLTWNTNRVTINKPVGGLIKPRRLHNQGNYQCGWIRRHNKLKQAAIQPKPVKRLSQQRWK